MVNSGRMEIIYVIVMRDSPYGKYLANGGAVIDDIFQAMRFTTLRKAELACMLAGGDSVLPALMCESEEDDG